MLKYLYAKNEAEIPSLNGLRALSIFMVIIFHLGTGAGKVLVSDGEILTTIIVNLQSSVDLFFMLSGFLIYGGLLDEYGKNSKIDLKKFYLKRTFRIIPAYYICLIVHFIQTKAVYKIGEKMTSPSPEILVVKEKLANSLANSWTDFLYISNFFHDRLFSFGWSLSIEEQFYLVVPPLCSILLFKQKAEIRRIILVILYFIPMIIRSLYYHFDFTADWTSFHTESRFDAIIVGMLLTELVRWKPEFLKNTSRTKNIGFSIGAALSLCIALLMSRTNINSIFIHTYFQFSFAVLFIACLLEGNFWNFIFRSRFFTPIARTSYTMYLWHGMFLLAALRFIFKNNLPSGLEAGPYLLLGIYTVLFVFVVCVPIFYITERPFLAIRDYILKRMKKKQLPAK